MATKKRKLTQSEARAIFDAVARSYEQEQAKNHVPGEHNRKLLARLAAKRAALQKNPARRKPRTAAQKAATARMLAGLRAKRKGGTISAAAVRAAHRRNPTRALAKPYPQRTTKGRIIARGEHAKHKNVSSAKYHVQVKRGKYWSTIARFNEQAYAQDYGQSLVAKYPKHEFRLYW